MPFSVSAAIERLHSFTEQEIPDGVGPCETVQDMSRMMDYVRVEIPEDQLDRVIREMPSADRRDLMTDMRVARAFSSSTSVDTSCTMNESTGEKHTYTSKSISRQIARFDDTLAQHVGPSELTWLVRADEPDGPLPPALDGRTVDEQVVLQMTNAHGISKALGRLPDDTKRNQFKARLGLTDLTSPVIDVLRTVVDRVAANGAKALAKFGDALM